MSTQPAFKNIISSDLLRIRHIKKTTFFKIQNREGLELHDKHEHTLMNQLQNQREQIARDLHDGIGSQLTHIISRLDIMAFSNKGLENQLSALRDFTSETVQQLRETIWVLNQPEITFGQLTERIKGLLSRITEDMDYPKIQVVSTGDKGILLAAPLTSSIFRIVQEAVNNALKYAEASAITITIKANNTTFSIRISDNGKGFCIEKAKKGYGLQNIQHRTKELSGQLLVESSMNGTNILVRFPLM